MEKVVGDLLLGLQLVIVSILPTHLVYVLYDSLGELRSRSLGLKRLNATGVAATLMSV